MTAGRAPHRRGPAPAGMLCRRHAAGLSLRSGQTQWLDDGGVAYPRRPHPPLAADTCPPRCSSALLSRRHEVMPRWAPPTDVRWRSHRRSHCLGDLRPRCHVPHATARRSATRLIGSITVGVEQTPHEKNGNPCYLCIFQTGFRRRPLNHNSPGSSISSPNLYNWSPVSVVRPFPQATPPRP